MPRKRIAELYIAIGFHKHGKTELYRDLLAHLHTTDDRFELAAGTPGLVMIVFTMPGYDVVVKIIRDRFPASKSVTRRQVMRQYRLVFRHDRAGRLVEAQEFEHLKFDRARFTEELLDELAGEATGTVEIGESDVVVHHAYVERRVTPLDVYVRMAGKEAARVATADFGQAIKDLAATDVFPGDLLPKNFGVTRHGRVVCYDYDELSLLTELSFRDMPTSDSYDDELSDDAWFGAGPRDVFPEEFPRFISLPAELKAALEASHRDLYERSFWTEMQERIQAGELVDIFPYLADRRLT
jgi:isocitrate dehydrogenase kinase/phosphatase